MELNQRPVSYYNSGCWTEKPCTYLILEKGIVTLHNYTGDKPEAVVEPEAMPAPPTLLILPASPA